MMIKRNIAFAMAFNKSYESRPRGLKWKTGEGTYSSPSIKISGWNVNGYRAIMRSGDLQNFMKKVSPDFMCLNQTKIDLSTFLGLPQELQNSFEGYNGYWNFCKIKSGYSGVAIFTKQKPLAVFEDFPNIPAHSTEGRVITLEYLGFYVVSVYKPNSKMDLSRLQYRTEQYDRVFNAYIKQLRSNKPVIIFGDMNVALTDIDIAIPPRKQQPGFTKQQRDSFSQLLDQNCLVDSYRWIYPFKRSYTWWSYLYNARGLNHGWRLDYILADNRLKVKNAAIHKEFFGSDHCPVSAILEIPQQK